MFRRLVISSTLLAKYNLKSICACIVSDAGSRKSDSSVLIKRFMRMSFLWFYFVFYFLQIEAQAFEPLEELVALRGIPCVDGIVVTAVLNIENLAVLA